jgi:hypothetical protein
MEDGVSHVCGVMDSGFGDEFWGLSSYCHGFAERSQLSDGIDYLIEGNPDGFGLGWSVRGSRCQGVGSACANCSMINKY